MSVMSGCAIESHVRAWLDSFILGLNLCPFARPVIASDTLRISICESDQLQQVAEAFMQELVLIGQSSEADIATTLLVLPNALEDFKQYLGFIDNAEAVINDMGLEGIIQLASFHPHYLFDGEPIDSASHYSNRSPFPIIHFLREEMLARVLADFSNPENIPQRNIATLQAIGLSQIEKRWNNL